ncbi:YfhO family protein [uncultured Ruminococcus sp.]|mgnify:CR=1 FL=1|uniref:YfhO family protein n=1 Tax=uncultured Ruminococcus sp. TaxID=165186 RepID=UPI00263A2554|nr:YfhO family protein [uncultured Ruminococcus sp.]
MATTKTKAAAALPAKGSISIGGILTGLKNWIVRNRVYLIAFAIPAALTYLAYAIFGLYPFGEESVLCLDLNGQYVYYFEALRDAFWGDGSIFYNWSRNLSGEFMGIIGYYLASPFTLIVLLLPEKFMLSSLLIMQLCKLGAAGVTFNYFLQKRRGVQPYPSLLFSTMYAMMAYAVIQLIDPMWLDGIVFLPLIMLGIEYLVDDGRRLHYIIPLAIMCVANFYIGYMICFFVILYFLFYLFLGSDKKRKGYDYFTAFVRIAYSSLIALACAAFMLLPVYNALKLGKFEFTDPDYSFRFQSFPLSKTLLESAQDSPLLVFLCDLLDMLPQLLPAQYDSVNVQGKPEIYCGLLTVVLLPLFYLNKNISRKKKIGYSALIFVMIMCMLITPVDMMWHGGQVPNWLPFRYSFLLSFVFLSMAATAFANLEGIKKKHLLGTAIGLIVFIAVVAGMKFEQMAKGAVWISAAIMGIYLILLYFMTGGKLTQGKRGVSIALTTMMLFMVGGEATYNAIDSMKDIDEEVAYSTRKSYQNYMQNGRAAADMLEEKDDGFYRAEKTFFRCVNDNAGFGLNGISHSSSVMNTRIINFIETMGYCMHSYYTRYDGNTEVADSLLGIKYVLDRGDSNDQKRRLNPAYEARWAYDYTNENGTDKTITAYENTNALSIGYMVDSDVTKIDHLGNDNPFNSQNIFMSTMSGNTTFDDAGQFSSWHEYYTPLNLAENPIVSDAITTSPYGEQTKYDVTGDGDPTVDFHLVAESEEPIYIYFKTEFQKEVNLWMSTWDETEWSENEAAWRENNTGDFTWAAADNYAKDNGGFESMGQYFEGDNYIALRLGTFAPGTKITLRMTVANQEKFTIVKNFLFYTYHPSVFQEDIDILKKNQWQIDAEKSNDRKLVGTITAEEGQLMMTTIPDQPGWTVKVDGKKVDQLVIVDALIGVNLEPGTHTVTMTYTPPGWWIGMGLLGGGLILIVLFWFGDRKRYAAMLVELEAEKERERQQAKKRAKLKSKSSDEETPEKLLEKLETLHNQGILTDAEFEAKKAAILKKKDET